MCTAGISKDEHNTLYLLGRALACFLCAPTHILFHICCGGPHRTLQANRRNKDVEGAVSEVEYVLTYCRQMDALSGEEDVLPGLGGTTVRGGPLAEGAPAGQLRDLFRVYLNTKMDASGRFSAELDDEATQLAKVRESRLTPIVRPQSHASVLAWWG